MANFLDATGLTRFWGDVKIFLQSRGAITLADDDKLLVFDADVFEDINGVSGTYKVLKNPTLVNLRTYLAGYFAPVSTANAMIYKGAMDCSTNPNFPAADAGDTYKVSVAGKIGGASGVDVEVQDMFVCTTDGTMAGTQAAVGANWNVFQGNISGAITDLGIAIHNLTAKATPADADELSLSDSAASWASKKFTFTNLKAFLKTYFDTLYALTGHNHDAAYSATGHNHDAAYAPASHVGATGAAHGNATGSVAGFITAADFTKLSGIEAAADVTDAANVGAVNWAAAAKATPLDADTFPISDTAASNGIKKVTFTALKAFLKTYFDTLYALTGHNHDAAYSATGHNHNTTYAPIAHVGAGGSAHADVVAGGASGFMTGALATKLNGIEALADVTDGVNVGSAMWGAAAKVTPIDADTMVISDTAASNVIKKVTFTNIKAFLKTYFDTLYATASHAHTTFDRATAVLSGANVFSDIVVTDGIVTAISTRALAAADVGAAASGHNHSGVYEPVVTPISNAAIDAIIV